MTAAMRLLISDRLRRTNRWILLCLVASVGLSWWFGPYSGAAGRAMTTSMAIALIAGPQAALQFLPRPLWYLPVSRRELWRANWLVSTIGVTMMTTAAKLVALLVPTSDAASLGIASIALSALFDFAAAGAGCVLVIAATHPRPSAGVLHVPWAIARGTAEMLLPLGFVAIFYLPGWIGLGLPAHWSDLTASSGTILGVFVALGIATWWHVPTPLTPANRIGPRGGETTVAKQPVRQSALTGMPRLLLREAAWAFAIAGSLACGSVLIVLVMARVGRDQQFLMEFLRNALHIADAGGTSKSDAGYVAFNLLIWYSLFASAVATRFPLMLRHLRALPFGAFKLNALLVAWPALIWVTAWIAGASLHYLVLGHGPTRFHGPAIVALVGLCALAQAISLRFSTITRLMVFASGAGLVPFAGLVPGLPPAALGLVGVSAILAAVALNHAALARNTTYKAVPLPLGT